MRQQKRITSPIPFPGGDSHERPSALKSSQVIPSSLIDELANQYYQNNDLGVIQSWFRKRRHRANEEHLVALLSRVNTVRAHTQSLTAFRAELITQADRLELEISKILEASENEVTRQREEHETFLIRQEMERERVRGELARMKLENDKIRLEHERIKAENRLVELRGELIEKITTELDMKNISPPQAFVLIKALNPNSKDSDVFMAQEQLEQMKAEADLKKAEARKAGYAADYEEYKMNESMKPSDV